MAWNSAGLLPQGSDIDQENTTSHHTLRNQFPEHKPINMAHIYMFTSCVSRGEWSVSWLGEWLAAGRNCIYTITLYDRHLFTSACPNACDLKTNCLDPKGQKMAQTCISIAAVLFLAGFATKTVFSLQWPIDIGNSDHGQLCGLCLFRRTSFPNQRNKQISEILAAQMKAFEDHRQ